MKLGIRQKFSVVFVLLILVPALALGFVTFRLVRDALVEQVEKEQLALLQSIKTNVVDRHLQDMENALRALAQDERLPRITVDSEVRSRIIKRWELTRSLFPERSWIYFGSRENEIIVSPHWEPPDGYDCRERPWYAQARYAEGIVWVEPYAEYVTGDLVMSAAMPIHDPSGTFRGVLSIDTHMNGFFRLLRQDAGTRTPQIIAVSERGRTYMLNEKEQTRFDLASLPAWEELDELTNQGRYLEYGGKAYYATFVDAPKIRLKLVSLLRTRVLYEEIHPILWALFGISISFIAVALLAGAYFSRHFITNIERLDAYMQAVESGDYRIRYCVSTQDEFYQLNSRLNTMVHHLAENINALTVESNTDVLCEIRNRRYLLEAIERHVRASPGREGSLSLVIVDVDHFKVVNDSFGHATGDDVLRRIGRLMAAAFPREATVGRYGGEEFIALLPGGSERDAAAYAEAFRATVEAQSWRERDLVVTISAGVAEAEDGDSRESLLQKADHALYRAKREGRNRVAHGSKTTPSAG